MKIGEKILIRKDSKNQRDCNQRMSIAFHENILVVRAPSYETTSTSKWNQLRPLFSSRLTKMFLVPAALSARQTPWISTQTRTSARPGKCEWANWCCTKNYTVSPNVEPCNLHSHPSTNGSNGINFHPDRKRKSPATSYVNYILNALNAWCWFCKHSKARAMFATVT